MKTTLLLLAALALTACADTRPLTGPCDAGAPDDAPMSTDADAPEAEEADDAG